ncbi:MAG: glycosyltransferase [bacterium]
MLFCAFGSREKTGADTVFYTMNSNVLYRYFSKKKILKELADIFIGGIYLLRIFIKERIDTVSVHYSESLGLPAVLLAKIFGKKTVVLWPTSSLKHSKMTEGRLLFISEKIYSFLSDVFLAKGMPSEQMRMYFRVKKNRLFETVNPVEQKDYDPGLCNFSDKRLGVYYLGKYNDFKRPDILVKAVSLLDEEKRKCICVSLYGNGPYEAMIKNLVKELKLESVVAINPPTRDVKQVIKNNHLFVYPSLYEPAFSQSILESLGSGRVVICRNTKGVSKYFKEDSILGVLPMNEKRLSDAISWVIDNREKAEQMALKAKSIISKEFTFENFMNQFMAHL